MIVGIGCDIVEHQSAKLLKWETDFTFLERHFSSTEIKLLDAYPRQKIRFIAGRFAGKEAVLKCLGTGMQDGISLTHIQIVSSLKGIPIIKLDGEAQKIAKRLKIDAWHISITHSNNMSFAFAIAEKNNKLYK